MTAMVSLSGCGLRECQRNIERKDFKFDAMLDEADVKVLLDDWGFTQRDTIPCETVCIYAFERDDGWVPTEIAHCEHDIAAKAGEDPTTLVGHVACDGVAADGLCE
jgi:hypothetical protein